MSEKSFLEKKQYLESIDGVYSVKSHMDEELWFLNSQMSQHITRMIREQKPARDVVIEPRKSAGSGEPKDVCFYKDNYAYRQKRYVYEV